jgi:hypothetical protein
MGSRKPGSHRMRLALVRRVSGGAEGHSRGRLFFVPFVDNIWAYWYVIC